MSGRQPDTGGLAAAGVFLEAASVQVATWGRGGDRVWLISSTPDGFVFRLGPGRQLRRLGLADHAAGVVTAVSWDQLAKQWPAPARSPGPSRPWPSTGLTGRPDCAEPLVDRAGHRAAIDHASGTFLDRHAGEPGPGGAES